jgi:hypothetical protein
MDNCTEAYHKMRCTENVQRDTTSDEMKQGNLERMSADVSSEKMEALY